MTTRNADGIKDLQNKIIAMINEVPDEHLPKILKFITAVQEVDEENEQGKVRD